MTPAAFLSSVIDPALTLLHDLGGPSPTDAARRMLLAIACQESGLVARVQRGGPANSWWQFEEEGVEGVLQHPASAGLAKALLQDLVIPAGDASQAIIYADLLAAGLARLLLWTDPHPLPTDEEGAWEAYSRLWRPGRPDRARWATSWATALQPVPEAGTGPVA